MHVHTVTVAHAAWDGKQHLYIIYCYFTTYVMQEH